MLPFYLLSFYITHCSFCLSQDSQLEAIVYGLEPYSQYSLQIEALNRAGRLNLLRNEFKRWFRPATEHPQWICPVTFQAACPVRGWTLGPWRLLQPACLTSQWSRESRAGRYCSAGIHHSLQMESSRYIDTHKKITEHIPNSVVHLR